MKSLCKKVVTVATVAFVAGQANAAADFSSIAQGADFSTAITGVIAIAAAIAGVYVAIAGARSVLRMIKGA